ncbi:DUF2589 domain-containing protein [Leptobacterium flavescens]|uniref:DUF2589 domain-containing protein n=1 Tax=Leptobacterium flavescens TaxID=472055 RepID=A0A6P0US62_9FLAO|nr:DUF2589 domain-containing protein [Leptobacterium flavescens]NER13713.1 DUF2589 domain-containing protein [Leptobacterium flavescens]
MAQQRFDHLLQAIHNAVLRAQELTEEQHIHQLDKYFDEDGKPITQEISVPTLDPEDDPDNMVVLKVPLMSLLPPSAIKIRKLKLKFQAGLGKIKLGDADSKQGPSLDIDMGSSGGFFGKNQATADVEITFESGEPSESFLRINDYLVKSVV